MSTAATIPFALAYAAPVRRPIRWVAGAASAACAAAALALSGLGQAAAAGSAIGDAWAGAMFAVVAVAAAVTGLLCGSADAVLGKGDRTLSALGAACNVVAGGVVFAMWM
jgi:hypothetical protein